MIDLFGLGKTPQEPTEPAPEPLKPPENAHGLWLSLLVLDSIFVIVFGGAVAAKAYQYWRAPAVVALPVVRRRPMPKPAELPKAPVPPLAPKAVEAQKAIAKSAAKTAARRADSPRPPKPSLINEPKRTHATPGLSTIAAAKTAAKGAPASTKAQPVVFKLRSADADAVQLIGAFIVHGGRKDMTQGKDGTWSVKLYLNPGQYRYFFFVDKKKTLDPENPKSDRGASLLTVPRSNRA